MIQFMKRTRVVFAVIVIMSLIVTIFGIFRPMKAEIETNLYSNFSLLAKSRVQSLETAIDKSIQGAQSLSSRTMIKNEIVRYHDGTVSFDALADYTKEKYVEGVEALDGMVFAQRYVDGKPVCTVDICDMCQDGLTPPEETDSIRYHMVSIDGKTFLNIVSPIMGDSEVIGYDSVFYTFDDMLATLNDSEVQLKIISPEFLTENHYETEKLYDAEDRVYYFSNISDAISVSVSTPRTSLLKSLQMLSRMVIYRVITGYLIVLLVVYILIIRFANHQISKLTSDRDNYKSYANQDFLTGAYSRLFLETMTSDCERTSFRLILIDLDNFKEINDRYGHAKGDDVLKFTVNIFKRVVRESDFVVRYGGDEFLLLVRNADIETAERLIDRIKEAILESSPFEFPIGFSYGISQFDSADDIYERIRDADKNMYADKRFKKTE
jgi:diguanylate cyclase (GGDEF)-like protein